MFTDVSDWLLIAIQIQVNFVHQSLYGWLLAVSHIQVTLYVYDWLLAATQNQVILYQSVSVAIGRYSK